MIDLHAHVLFDVDDGPSSLEHSVELCRAARRAGVREIVATPHQLHPRWLNDEPARLLEKLERLQSVLGPEPQVTLGGEIRISSDIFEQLESAEPKVCPVAGSRYLLLEFPREQIAINPEELTRELRLSGWYPIYAHPECIPWLASDLDTLFGLVEAGGLLQITTTSLFGGFGRLPRYTARQLLEANCAHFLASDTHDLTLRPPDLERGRSHLARKWGEERAWQLTEGNPLRVLQDLPLKLAA